jgi:NADH dehydrogenase
MKRPRIVIIGAGFGGIYAALALAKRARRGDIDVTIVNRTNYFLFTPLLHEVATGGLTPTSVTEPLREIFAGSGIRIRQGEVVSIDPAAKVVRLGDGELRYDRAVIATGAVSNDYGIPGAAEHALPLKTLSDAILIRERVIDAFERATTERDEEVRKGLLSFAVVGGGATGVETAGELADFAADIERRYHRTPADGGFRSALSVSLLSADPALLMIFPPFLRKAAAERLRRNGIDVRLNTAAASVEADGVRFKDGSVIRAGTVIWAAGVKPRPPKFIGFTPELVGGRLCVDRSFRMPGADGLYALGDAAAFIDDRSGKPLPMSAQAAVASAVAAARNVLADLDGQPTRVFRFRSKGSLVSVGQWFAVGEIFFAPLRGRFAWWIWRTVYLFKFVSWKKRLRVAFEWTVNLVYPRDVTKLT